MADTTSPSVLPRVSPRTKNEDSLEKNYSLRILKLRKQLNKKSVYECDSRELRQWLKPVKDMEVAVIPIVGPSRMGKSFMLNYMSRYLMDPKNSDWMGRLRTPLEGFSWKAEIDPQTDGIWISRPHIIEKGNGNKIVVILCDTQGVFDQYSNERDWSTIVGISLLISSCLIFNIFSNLQEDALIFLESFLEYGLTAAKSLPKMESEKPFQKLLFLIRDWALPQRFKFGLGGGNDYLQHKLTIEEEQNDSAQNARQLLKDCFQELECFLMPKIGEKSDETNFNGSVGQLGQDFKRKLNEFIVKLLNPDEIQPKRINEKNITGEEFCDLFESYVSVFNSTSMDKPSTNELLSATSRIADNIHLRRVKVSHLKELQSLVESKPFFSRKDLSDKKTKINSEYMQIFEDEMSSDDNEVIVKMEDSFEQNYEIIYEINENRRMKFIEKIVDECCQSFRELSSTQLSGDTDLIAFDDFLKTNENQVLQVFKSNYNGEEESLFFKEYLHLTECLSKLKDQFRKDHIRHQSEEEKYRTEFLEKSLQLYENDLQHMIDENKFLTKDQFKQLENQIRAQTIESFEKQFKSEESKTNRYYVWDLKERLKKLKNEFKDKNEMKSKEVFKTTEQLMYKTIEDYNKNMNQIIEELQKVSSELNQSELDKRQKTWKKIAMNYYENQFLSGKPSENLYFKFQQKLSNKIDQEFDKFVEEVEGTIQNIQSSIEEIYRVIIDKLNKKLNKAIQKLTNEQELDDKLADIKLKLTKEFKDQLNLPNQFQVQKAVQNLDESMDRLISESKADFETRKTEIKKSFESDLAQTLDYYSQKMEPQIEQFADECEFEQAHRELKKELIRNFIFKHESIFGVDPRDYERSLSSKIDEQFHRIVHKRNQTIGSIEEKVEAQHNRYINVMADKIDMFLSEKDLVEEHNIIEKQILDTFREQNESVSRNILSKNIQTLKLRIIKTFDELKRKSSETQQNIIKSIENKFNELIHEYSKEMDSNFRIKEFYSTEDLRSKEDIIRQSILLNFEQFLNQFKINKQNYTTKLNNKIEEIFTEILNKNRMKRLSTDEGLREECRRIREEYKMQMNSNIEANVSIKREAQLIELHEKVIKQLLNEVDHIGFTENATLVSFKKNIEKELAKIYKGFEEQIKLKLIEYYNDEQTKLKEKYIKELDKLLEKMPFPSKQSLNKKHQEIKAKIDCEFEVIFNDDFELIKENFSMERDQALNQLFVDKCELILSQQKDELTKLVNDFCLEYQTLMEPIVKSVELKSELDEKHQEFQNHFKKVFKPLAIGYIAEEEVQPYLDQLEGKIREQFDNSIVKQWEIETRHIKPMIENLQFKVSKYYQDEMEKKTKKQLFVEEKELMTNHTKISENFNKKFRNEFAMLSDKTYSSTVQECIKLVFDKVVTHNEMYRPNKTHAIGIDLGTTNSCVSYFCPSTQDKFFCVIVPNELGGNTTSSVVSIRDNEEVIGDVAKEETYIYPKNTIMSAKRLIGRRFNDESVQKSLKLWSYDVFDDGNNNPKINIKVNETDLHYYPEQISAKVLKRMKDISATKLGCDVTKAVITVPAYFNDAQKKATKDAAKIAGLEVMRIINEPTAAAIAYRLNWKIEGSNLRNVLIYDFGGGTFDVAILTISQGEIDVKAVGGDNNLGGDDFDTNIIKYCLEDFNRKHNETMEGDEAEKAIACRLRLEAERCKIRLSALEQTNIHLRGFYNEKDLKVVLTRNIFEDINKELIERSMDLVLKTLTESKLSTNDIDDIVLVGGSTRIPKIKERLSEVFGGRPLNHSVNPDEAVAVGAAINAAMLNEEQSVPLANFKLSDVNPHSLGIYAKDERFFPIIPKNTKIPVKITERRITVNDNQTEVTMDIYEGENEFVKDNNLLGKFTIKDVPADKAGAQKIDITFELTDEGILIATAKVISTGQVKNTTIIAVKSGISPDQLEELIKEGV